jgi:hypothetical protein
MKIIEKIFNYLFNIKEKQSNEYWDYHQSIEHRKPPKRGP